MEQFSLEEYLKKPSRKVVTRDGRSARIICTDMKNSCPICSDFSIVTLISDDKGEFILTYKEDGRLSSDDNDFDLFFLPEKKSVWVFLYKNSDNESGRSIVTVSCQTREQAEQRMKECDGFSLTEITWEE